MAKRKRPYLSSSCGGCLTRRNFLLAAGLEDTLAYLETLRFSAAEIDWLKSTRRFRDNLIDYLAEFRFTGDVHAIPEGTVCFPNEPLVRITAPLPVAQLVETRLINIMHFQTMIASKAARMVLAAPGKILSDFGLAHGTRCGGGPFLRARQLHRRIYQCRQRACRRALRHSDCRDHGAFLRTGAWRRE